MDLFKPRVIMTGKVKAKLRKCVQETNLQYETGGILIGYICLRVFYIIAVTFSERQEGTTRMTFILNGEDHVQKMEKIREKYCFPPRLIGVWHSHTTEDCSLSLQDRESNKMLASLFGEIISVVIARNEEGGARMAFYYISE